MTWCRSGMRGPCKNRGRPGFHAYIHGLVTRTNDTSTPVVKVVDTGREPFAKLWHGKTPHRGLPPMRHARRMDTGIAMASVLLATLQDDRSRRVGFGELPNSLRALRSGRRAIVR